MQLRFALPDTLYLNDTMKPTLSQTIEQLDLHAQRRRSGLPTATLLVDTDAAAAFEQWTQRQGVRPIAIKMSDPSTLPAALLTALAAQFNFYELALRALCASAGLPIPVIAAQHRLSASEVDQLVAAAALPDPHGAMRIAHRLLREASFESDASLLDRLDAELREHLNTPGWRVLRAVSELLPPQPTLAVLLSVDANAGITDRSWLSLVSPCIYQFAQTLPQWTIATTCSPEALERYAASEGASRSKSILLMGVVRANTDKPPSVLAAEFANSPASIVDAGKAAVSETNALSAAPRVQRALQAAVQLQGQADEAARSAAERLLFELLESDARTAGCFVLNGDAGFRFGQRAAEVDLLARKLRLAVEVDGYYHFTDFDAYRRDRRKDFQLQRHGYTVVRVLADDVIMQTDNVLGTVFAAVEHCRKTSTGETLARDA